MTTPNPPDPNERAAQFDKTEERLEKAQRDAFALAEARAERLDRTLLTLSGGTLGFSITLLTRATMPHEFLCILFLSWGTLAASLIGVVLAIRESQSDANSGILSIASDLETVRQSKRRFLAEGGEMTNCNPVSENKRIVLCNQIALWGFVVGIILLGLFAALNLAGVKCCG
jgi:hypothetical protein